MVDKGFINDRGPKMDDIKKYLDKEYLLHALLNSRKLNDKEGYFSHAVVVTGYNQ
jgi:hypothetical protein